MKKLTIALILIYCSSHISLAQELSKTFGVVDHNDMDLIYEKDPEAEAVILFDIGKSFFFDTHEGYDIRFTRTKRIKIVNKAGIEYAEVSIPFYSDGYGKTEIIKDIEAYTYNTEDGRIFRKALDPSTVYEAALNNKWNVKKFVFPDVKEGSVIEYRYILETPFHFNLPDWSFQDQIPTLYSEYKIGIIPFYEYVFLAQGMSKFDYYHGELSEEKRTFGSVSTSYGQNVGNGFHFQDMNYTYVMKDVPAFESEAYITSANDYIMKIDFQLAKFHSPRGGNTDIISTWPKLIEGFLNHDNFGKYIKGSQRQAKKIFDSELDLSGKSDLEKAKAIIDYVRASYSWNGSNSRYASLKPKEFLSQKSGNAADINLFLTGLLNAAGIDAKPVVISTRNHGKIRSDYPFEHFFNYVIVLVNVDGSAIVTDGTENKIAYDRIPPRCINEKGLVVDKDQGLWIGLESNILSFDNKDILLNIDPENLIATTKVSIQATEFESYAYKNAYNDNPLKIKEQLLQNGFSEVTSVNSFNYDKNDSPYALNYEGSVPLEGVGSNLIVSPFLNFPVKENLLKEKTRNYPVDFIYSKTEKFKSLINIPEGYDFVTLPENYALSNELADINIKYRKTDKIIEVEGFYSFKKAVYQSAEYARVKFYLDEIVKKFNEPILLSKNTAVDD